MTLYYLLYQSKVKKEILEKKYVKTLKDFYVQIMCKKILENSTGGIT